MTNKTKRKYGLYSIYKGEKNGIAISSDRGKLGRLKQVNEDEKRRGEEFQIIPVTEEGK